MCRTLPEEHMDISSSLYFASIVSAFIPIRFYEYHPMDLNLSALQSEAVDLVVLPFADASISSLFTQVSIAISTRRISRRTALKLLNCRTMGTSLNIWDKKYGVFLR